MNTAGIIMLLVSLVGGLFTCGATTEVMGIIGLIEGIIYLMDKPDKNCTIAEYRVLKTPV